jgi:hypothetical protein
MTTETLTRSSSERVTPEALRQLIKANLGYNARQVTVSSDGYPGLRITVRDASVDLAKVKAFAKPFHTAQSDETDYHWGQSVRVETTREVDEVHAAPHFEEIRNAVTIVAEGNALILSNGKYLQHERGEMWVTANDLADRGCYIRAYEAKRETWAVEALALQMARV